MAGQEYENDPIIAALFYKLGISPDDPEAELPPLDAVHGYYQQLGQNKFRLWLKDFTCFMQHFTERILDKSPSPYVEDGTRLVLNADDGYEGELVIVCPGAPENNPGNPGSPGNPEASYGYASAEFQSYMIPPTTPWHW